MPGKINKELLQELQKNGRESCTELAKIRGATEGTVKPE